MSDLDKVKKLAPTTLDRFRLDNKVALVVGGNKGLGQSMTLALAAAGADVCVVGRGPAGLEETSAAISGQGRRGTYFAADVTDEKQVARMVDHMLDTKFENCSEKKGNQKCAATKRTKKNARNRKT